MNQKLYSEREVLAELLSRFGLQTESATLIGQSQNSVFRCEAGGVPCIARLSSGRHRTRSEVEAELDWIEYLASRGVAVCRPLQSFNGLRCEELLADERSHLMVVFAWAPGDKPARDDLSESLYFKVGRVLAEMHRGAAEATRMGRRFGRKPWYESRLINDDVRTTTAPIDDLFRGSLRRLIGDVKAVPVGSDSHGLIHGDVNFGNCHLSDGKLHLFDFDNCEYGFFLQDFATLLYDSIYCRLLNREPAEKLNGAIRRLWMALLQGYRERGPLVDFPVAQLKRLFLIREAVIYLHYHRILPSETLQRMRPGLDLMRRNVEHITHQVDFDPLVTSN